MRTSRLAAFAALLALAACSSNPSTPAPIIDKNTPPPAPAPAPVATPVPTPAPAVVVIPVGTYIVKKGDTLYRIAHDNGIPFRDLATWNNLNENFDIKVGQALRLTPPDGGQGKIESRPLNEASPAKTGENTTLKSYPRAVKAPYGSAAASQVATLAEGNSVASKQQPDESRSVSVGNKTTPAIASGTQNSNSNKTAQNASKADQKVASSSLQAHTNTVDWGRPAAGKVINRFTSDSKGIDIAGQIGQPVVASAQGKVVYAGSGLKGYGKMVIIQHDNGFLTAYAHNSKLVVKEGDIVQKGEKIAEIGNTDADQIKLHFEMRKFGKPVDPGQYINLD